MKDSYADVLESYMIAEEAGIKNFLIDTAIAAAIVSAIGLPKAIINEIKNRKQRKEKKNTNQIQNDTTQSYMEKYKSSPEYLDDCKYISNKYKVNYPDDYDKKILIDRIYESIYKDLLKIANNINNNKKLCNSLADKYLEQCKTYQTYEEYESDFEEEADEIRSGPVSITKFENYSFFISDIDQSAAAWVCHNFLYMHLCDLINEKYYREINLDIIDGISECDGDGDETLVQLGVDD